MSLTLSDGREAEETKYPAHPSSIQKRKIIYPKQVCVYPFDTMLHVNANFNYSLKKYTGHTTEKEYLTILP